MTELLIGLVPFIPAFIAFMIPLFYLTTKNRSIVFALTITAFIVTTYMTAVIAVEAYKTSNPIIFKAGGWPAPIGITYIVDRFTGLLALVTSTVLLFIAIYSYSYIVDEGYPWYNVLLLGNASGLLGVLYTGDLFNLFVMLEVTGVSAYALVMYYRNRAISIVSGLKYAFIGSLGTSLYLLAMGLLYNTYGTLNIVDFALKLNTNIDPINTVTFAVILVLSLWAFSIKSGVFPNHFWLPDAHPAAPTPISALLSGLVVNTGVVGVYKLLYLATGTATIPPLSIARSFIAYVILVTGGLSALVGSLLMNTQTDVKRIIAYSTVMNLGFLFMGIGCLTQTGLRATLYYTISHSIAKATLFLTTGIFIKMVKSRNLYDLSGTGMRNPLIGFVFTISTLSLAGIPPLPGFLGKLMLYEALFELHVGLAILMVVASAIGLLGYMKLLYIVVFGTPSERISLVDMKLAKISLVFLMVIIVAVGGVFLFNPDLTRLVFDSAGSQSTVNIVEYLDHLKTYIVSP